LPVVFVAENNGYGEATPFTYASSCTHIVDRANGYNMPGVQVDGKDVLAVYRAAEEAVARARRGEGPTLIECITYRNYGHFEGDAQKYKKEDDKQEHLNERDAIAVFRAHLAASQTLDETELADIENDVEAVVQESIRFAEESPYPEAGELLTDVYVSY
ncbi:thiamine pyrophosphate-dependent enzyme, partial [Paenibacillus chitinolyticus]